MVLSDVKSNIIKKLEYEKYIIFLWCHNIRWLNDIDDTMNWRTQLLQVYR